MATSPIGGAAAPVTLPGILPLMPALARVLVFKIKRLVAISRTAETDQ